LHDCFLAKLFVIPIIFADSEGFKGTKLQPIHIICKKVTKAIL
jgi:hypothetical protein